MDVIEILIKGGHNFHLTLIGDGPNRVKLTKMTKDRNLETFVDFCGESDYIEQFIWESDLYVHSALYEPFGLVLIEAMAGGLPVISLDGGGNRDIVVNGHNGYLLKGQDPEIFASAIINTISDAAQYRQMSANAVEFAKQYDIKPYVDRLLEIYRSN